MAVIFAVSKSPTGVVLTMNVDEVAPAGTVADDGTFALEVLDVRLMIRPPAGAILVSWTVPTADWLPTT